MLSGLVESMTKHQSSLEVYKKSITDANVAGGGDGAGDTTKPSAPTEMQSIGDMLKDALKPPADQAKTGAPQTPTVAIVTTDTSASDDERKERLASFKALTGISGIATLLAVVSQKEARDKRGHPEPYKLSDTKEAYQALDDQADTLFAAIKEPLSGFYQIGLGSTTNYSKTLTRGELHTDLLSNLFKGFALDPTTLGVIDGVMSQFVSAIQSGGFSVGTESKQMSFFLRKTDPRL